ncbi:MAG: hypothetical protein E7222_01690 [Clostridiales bacterium]|nr:hypothetical protein [Clostridiales bacterium]
MIMKKNMEGLVILCIAVLMCLGTYSTAFAGEIPKQPIEKGAVDLLENGVTIIDADGNIVSQYRYTIGNEITIPAGTTAYANKDCYYNGGRIEFYASLKGGGDVEYLDVVIWSPKQYKQNLGSFSCVNGQKWYGCLGVAMDNVFQVDPGKYYNYGLKNNFDVPLTVGSFTALN